MSIRFYYSFLPRVLWMLTLTCMLLAPNAYAGGGVGGSVGGGGAVQTLYSGDIGNCQAPGLDNMFSGFVCSYQEIVDQVMTNMYFAMLTYFQEPFFAAMTLFVIAMGAMFALGMLPFTTRDIMIILAKIAIVSGFAMYPELLIDLLYQGLIGFMYDTTNTVVRVLAPDQGSVNGIFVWMDQQLNNFLTTQDAAQTNQTCDSDILALLFGLAITMPPIFAMALYLLIQLIMVFIRTVLGYLVAITGIMFLTTLAPVFMAFAFFRITTSYFEKWLSYLLGFAMQIFIVFSFIAVVLSLPFESKLQGAMDTVRPYDRVAFHDGQRLDFNNWCTICASAALGSPTQADTCTGDPITPTNVQVGGMGAFIDWVGQEIIILAVMAYLVEVILKAAPEVARFVAGGGLMPALGNAGLRGGGNALTQGIGAFGGRFIGNLRDTPGGIDKRGAKAVSDAFSQLVVRR